MLPTFMHTKHHPRRPNPPADAGRVHLVLPITDRPGHLVPFTRMVGIIEDYIGDEVLVNFGEIVLQVPAEWLQPAD